MRAGTLRHRVEIQQAEITRDSFGDEQEVWTAHATVWAAILPLVGREYFTAQQTVNEEMFRLQMRYVPGVQPAMRLVFGERVFNIRAIQNLEERNRELVIMATEVQ
jgi:SPP1 family predicted phage head-tail adaptor